MHKYLRHYLLIALFLLSVSACKKDDDDPKPQAGLPSFTAKINGIPFVATTSYCIIHSDHFLQFRAFSMIGESQGKMISLTFLDADLTETINAGTSANWFGLDIGYEDAGSGNSYSELMSNLQFTAADSSTNMISGVFNGAVAGSSPQDTVYITDGVFQNINYIYEVSY